MELAAKAIAYVAMTSKTYAAELVERSLSCACEWLEEADRNETRRLAAVSLVVLTGLLVVRQPLRGRQSTLWKK